ncbi:MAG: hypothetical protein A3A43_03275 [Candidatus Liptonbacteria bacterium RIFCSPLOWO2_01_FULL_56_20]|uniref:DUF192 domain-containing protein n=1 Tax=Candidatus Liptonbacteria bacterium RIFCSPLOWO2_01_FULL_56_20 TaxID=1798652 RepID=A0A1G2CKB6_9BACT|nr:MAG: hypothetical protein A2681_01520 [Candidatus Liptonbacteria bacterium RIFCSPHIGHO2_01_FULL_56_18b]OGZ01846.1 MAG: hypothetical protein A3A43_03275 [Candidatus Liptonbacteria bacterium RIFCSPLOWO2_01_FULL_56_20]
MKNRFDSVFLFVLLMIVVFGYALFGPRLRFGGGGGSAPTVAINGYRFAVEVMESPLSRSQGLSGRASLGEGAGMLFLFDTPGKYGFWMKDMNFAIDIIWVSGDRIVGFEKNVQPEPGRPFSELRIYEPPGTVDKVLEVRAGTVERYGFSVGDAMVFAR